ncbi:thiamine-phosphate kinase [Cytophaga hutchinsonii]|jgi:thiamine-monophosphate kinase|uniref:Thiamine-monophosphate kinase n=1 Tax=Cytophaga hutchinsonii (strain ATCC 33406 / DSM 1761 / CIP 103989 / NBRC 15051 / NCIMB 9469 / D465) TaxID=269798 RepID=A0A6N4STL4_CYTH3|nr:thiamine-phosphate kinase [Cytophaga hutchinsonii]ABG59775.1 thiamine-phosphate kinase [Cytophaga hutchinsonii ATCC 33406]SFX64356.1 thiamine-phosphate kinase [Cytophaga hutchinsonii ATCC 33406]
MDSSKRTELSEIGEFGLIDRLKEFLPAKSDKVIKSIGDDAAVIRTDENVFQFISTDLLMEGVHFDLAYTPLKHLGYKSVAVNVSDIAAMNGTASHIVVGIALSNRFSVEAIEELYTGMKLACDAYSIDLVGGDTTSSRSGLGISVTVVGEGREEEVAYRSGAQVNDLICVTGDLGAAFMGLQVLEREKQVYLANPEMQPELLDKEYIVQRQLRPEARVDVIKSFKTLGLKPNAMIDVSDGLASELLHICKESNVGAYIYEDKLPIDPMTFDTAREFELDPLTIMLNGGEDYELLFTIPQADYEKVRNHPDISVIGYIKSADEGVNIYTKGDHLVPVTAQGWNHFKA